MTYNLKLGADISGLHPAMWEVLPVIEACFLAESDGVPFTITEGKSEGAGVHGGGDPDRTLHDDGLAIDVRTRNLAPNKAERIRARIVTKLSSRGVQVVMHDTHMHVEREGFI